MPIIPTNPIIIPAIAQKSYDKIWIQSITIQASPETEKTVASVIFLPYRELELKDSDGNVIGTQKDTAPEKIIRFTIDDVFQLAASNPDVAQVVGSMMAILETLAKAKGVL